MTRRNSLLDPVFERRQNVMLGISAIRKGVRADAAAAMPHSRNHEQPVEVIDRFGSVASRVRVLPRKRAHALVVVNGIDRRVSGVAPRDSE